MGSCKVRFGGAPLIAVAADEKGVPHLLIALLIPVRVLAIRVVPCGNQVEIVQFGLDKCAHGEML